MLVQSTSPHSSEARVGQEIGREELQAGVPSVGLVRWVTLPPKRMGSPNSKGPNLEVSEVVIEEVHSRGRILDPQPLLDSAFILLLNHNSIDPSLSRKM